MQILLCFIFLYAWNIISPKCCDRAQVSPDSTHTSTTPETRLNLHKGARIDFMHGLAPFALVGF